MKNTTNPAERFVLGMPRQPDDRRWIEVDADDALAINLIIGQTFGPVTVTDLITGKALAVRSADCGFGCRCALEEVR